MPSSVIRSFRYLPAEKALEVIFVTGRRYRYLKVPEKLHRQMRAAFSKGEFFNAHVRDHFAFERMESVT